MTEATQQRREPEALPGPVRRRRSRPLAPPPNPRARLRAIYFSIAAIWGFVIGAAAILGSLSFLEQVFRPDGTTLVVVSASAVMALAGGIVTARAYRDASSGR